MSDIVIKAEGLGKKYTIGHQSDRERYHALRDVMARNLKGLWQNARDIWSGKDVIQGEEVEEFWALKDVNFEIHEGETVGIIGRNGAGKSTLLKVLSRITEPSAGKVTIKGRVASLLEVGTGFHPELTGRENVFLNGAILGMSRKEIKSKFDEIVDFAGIEKFLDTPVKRYSSGMYVRLAFAVAAHLDPEILLVDEVLAVGDAEFQKKCVTKIGDVSNTGKTVLIVSHQMAMIEKLAVRSILLDQGMLVDEGPSEKIITQYLNLRGFSSGLSLWDRKDRRGNGIIKFKEVYLQNGDGDPTNFLRSGGSGYIVLVFENMSKAALHNLRVDIGIDGPQGDRIAILSSDLINAQLPIVEANKSEFVFKLDRLPLNHGRYGFTIFCCENGTVADWIQNAGFIDVEAGDYWGTGKCQPDGQGYMLLEFSVGMR